MCASVVPMRGRFGGLLRSAWAVALVIMLFYGVWTANFLSSGHEIRDFILIGSKFILRSSPSAVITYDPHYSYTVTGYDGQFCYYLALDPINARYYMDNAAYRYTRVLYPLLARVLAFGQPGVIPYTLLIINWLAIGGGTLALAAWLKRRSLSPWFALIYGLYPGLFIALDRDLTEPLAFALVALAVYLFDMQQGYRRAIWAGASFALAILTRESVALFALLFGLALLFEQDENSLWRLRLAANWRKAAVLLGLALIPFGIYKVFLIFWLGSAGLPTSDLFPQWIPFQGILVLWPWQVNQIAAFLCVILPALICAGMGLYALWKRRWPVEVWALLANILLFVVLAAPPIYMEVFSVSRVTIGVVLAACYCLPCFDALTRKKRLWLWASALLWSALIPVLAVLVVV